MAEPLLRAPVADNASHSWTRNDKTIFGEALERGFGDDVAHPEA